MAEYDYQKIADDALRAALPPGTKFRAVVNGQWHDFSCHVYSWDRIHYAHSDRRSAADLKIRQMPGCCCYGVCHDLSVWTSQKPEVWYRALHQAVVPIARGLRYGMVFYADTGRRRRALLRRLGWKDLAAGGNPRTGNNVWLLAAKTGIPRKDWD